jgi:hypothetical protein
MKTCDYVIVDDSGLLGLVDCKSYQSFISPDWTYEEIVAHFSEANRWHSLAVWECGDGGDSYVIRVRQGITSESGFRQITGAIRVTAEALNLVSYDSLTMAAQFSDEVLPPKHERDLCIELPNGDYQIRVIQTYDPSCCTRPKEPHFIIEYAQGKGPPWDGVAWLSEV